MRKLTLTMAKVSLALIPVGVLSVVFGFIVIGSSMVAASLLISSTAAVINKVDDIKEKKEAKKTAAKAKENSAELDVKKESEKEVVKTNSFDTTLEKELSKNTGLSDEFLKTLGQKGSHITKKMKQDSEEVYGSDDTIQQIDENTHRQILKHLSDKNSKKAVSADKPVVKKATSDTKTVPNTKENELNNDDGMSR